MKIRKTKRTTTIYFGNSKNEQEFAWKLLESMDPNTDEADFVWPDFDDPDRRDDR